MCFVGGRPRFPIEIAVSVLLYTHSLIIHGARLNVWRRVYYVAMVCFEGNFLTFSYICMPEDPFSAFMA